MSNNEQEIMILILNKYINSNYDISVYEYMFITCWSTINDITLHIFNDFIKRYHDIFPDLKIRSDKALQYYDIYINEINNKQYIIDALGETLNNYFIVPSNMLIIMQTSTDNLAYYHIYDKSNPDNIVPHCYINKNYK